MADYQAHIAQAKRNLTFLAGINQQLTDTWDWQVTAAYYVAVHLMNGHLAKKANLHYKTHADVKNALFARLSPCKIPDDIYTSFVKLENLSRRSRYLCNDDIPKNDDTIMYQTYDKHLKKALQYLDKIMVFFCTEYGVIFDKQKIDCIEMKVVLLSYFEYKQKTNQSK